MAKPSNADTRRELSQKERDELMSILAARFNSYPNRHKGLDWKKIQERLLANPQKLWSLHQMESTGGEPDVAGFDEKPGEYIFFDCSAETPKDRRSLCYDRKALESRKEFKPRNSAVDAASSMGVDLMNEKQYMEIQTLGKFDTRTSSWLKTPPEIRELGGAIFGDRRYNHVFIYHNGAESYYSGRGFRGVLRV